MTSLEHAVMPEELMAFLDGEVAPERARDIQAHLETCARCRQTADDLRRVSDRMSQWTIDPPPVSLRAPAVPAQARVLRLPVWRRRPVLSVAAAAVLVLVAASVVMRWRSERAQAPVTPARSVTAAATLKPVPEAAADALAAATRAPSASSYMAGRPVESVSVAQPRGALIARTASLRLFTRDLDAARAALETIVRNANGYLGDMNAGGAPEARWVHATLRVPADTLESTMAAIRQIGRVLEESQNADDVTEQSMDIDVRLANGKRTEQRLVELLGNRTGRLSDVLAVERELARVRTEIEGLETQRKALDRRVTYATVSVQIAEEPKASVTLGPTPLTTRLRNAAVDGARTALDSIVRVVLFAFELGPTLLLWALLLAWPARVLLRRFRNGSHAAA